MTALVDFSNTTGHQPGYGKRDAGAACARRVLDTHGSVAPGVDFEKNEPTFAAI
ncbi:MAG: hypothetical protein JO267_02170 [Alphaproteobacteria bacterium]|nr:hypothetical protein [Alphaproteobacteria bacterium]